MKPSIFLTLVLVAGFPAFTPAALFSNPDTVEEIQAKLQSLPADGRRSEKVNLYSRLGDLYFQTGQPELAAGAFEKALQHNPSSAMKAHIYRYLGKSYEGFDRLDRAVDAAIQAVEYNKKYWRCHRDLARLYEKILLYPKAIDSYQLAIKYNAKEAALYLELGRTWRKMGLVQKAELSLNKAKALDERSSALYQEFSLVYEGQSRFEDSAQAIKKTLTEGSSPKEWGRLIYLSALAGNKGLANEGLQTLRKVETSSDSVSFYEELVDLLQKSPETIFSAKISDPTLKSLIQSVRP